MSKTDDIEHLAHLCRIKLSKDRKAKTEENLKKVLNYISQLEEVDTTDVLPCTTILETMVNVMGEDKERSIQFSRESFLQNAPDQVGGMIKVPPVIQFEE